MAAKIYGAILMAAPFVVTGVGVGVFVGWPYVWAAGAILVTVSAGVGSFVWGCALWAA